MVLEAHFDAKPRHNDIDGGGLVAPITGDMCLRRSEDSHPDWL
jgi:hypothetical protein